MGVLDKFLDVMKLNSEEDDEFYDDDYEEEYEEEVSRRKSKKREAEQDSPSYTVVEKKAKDKQIKVSSKVTPMRTSKKSGAGMEVCVIKPNSFEDAREITETLLANRTVILNVEGLNLDIAQRIIDFACGSTFAIDGNLQKISNYIFIVTPPSVDISGDFQELVDSFDIAGIQTSF